MEASFYFYPMEEKSISFEHAARYSTLAPAHEVRAVWFVLHGYGQLARYFVKKFKSLSDLGIKVVAPEGLSRFYLENFDPEKGRPNDRVGATWMTKEDRLRDIANYINYLDSVYQAESIDHSLPVTILGFSQGAATASRWVTSNNIKFESLILWAGIFPSDMTFEQGSLLREKKVKFVHGSSDPFLGETKLNEMRSTSAKLFSSIEEITFNGEHDIDEPTLIKLATSG
jgi:predicted esterase